MLKNPVSFCRIKIFYQQFLTFLSFMNIFRSNRSQMFFKIGTLKIFCNILNWGESPTQVFSCEYCKILKNSFFTELLLWLLLHYFKSNKTVTTIFKEISLLWHPNKFFFSTHFRETYNLMYKKSNSFVYKLVVNFQVF